MFPLSLNAPVGAGFDNEEDDVKAMATNLSWLGYPESETAAETGRWDGGAETGLRNYQSERGLTVDGWAAPGGETERTLNGDGPRAGTMRDEAPFSGSGALGRLLGRLPHLGDGRASGGLLDLDTPARAAPFAAARAYFAREGSPGRGDHLSATRDASDHALGDNTVTAEPLKLKPLLELSHEADPPASLSLDEIERTLTKRGYRYRPDPMGRVGEGDWLDASGNVVDAIQAEGIVRGEPNRSGSGDFVEYAQQVLGLPTRADALRVLEEEREEGAEPVQDDGGGRSWRGLFRSNRGTIVGGPHGFPPELASRLAHIKDPTARSAVERLLQGSVAEKGAGRHPHARYNLYKPGNTSTGMREFRQTVVRMGGSADKIKFEEPGRWSYAGVDGTRLTYRRAIEGKRATNEIHIDRVADKPANIKIRYDD